MPETESRNWRNVIWIYHFEIRNRQMEITMSEMEINSGFIRVIGEIGG
jgi:hypothetical protein